MRISATDQYHLHDLSTLGWELTVCNALAPRQSPCRRILARDDPYGEHLYRFLGLHMDMKAVRRVLEVGGGYGYLLEDFFRQRPDLSATMIDISPFLLERQEERLGGFDVDFRRADFLAVDMDTLPVFDLAILNENLGDFLTAVNLTPSLLAGDREAKDVLEMRDIRRLYTIYDLPVPADGPFHFNLGAALALEKLCRTGIPGIFVSEHSCEARVPEDWASFLGVSAPGSPERIPLKGHDEYTIQFSHLERIGRSFGYRVLRGPIANYLIFSMTDRLRSCLHGPCVRSDEDEILRQFVEDLYQYEYLLLTKPAFSDFYAGRWEDKVRFPLGGLPSCPVF